MAVKRLENLLLRTYAPKHTHTLTHSGVGIYTKPTAMTAAAPKIQKPPPVTQHFDSNVIIYFTNDLQNIYFDYEEVGSKSVLGPAHRILWCHALTLGQRLWFCRRTIALCINIATYLTPTWYSVCVCVCVCVRSCTPESVAEIHVHDPLICRHCMKIDQTIYIWASQVFYHVTVFYFIFIFAIRCDWWLVETAKAAAAAVAIGSPEQDKSWNMRLFHASFISSHCPLTNAIYHNALCLAE